MRVDVLFFGILKDFAGPVREWVELAEGACVADLVAVLQGRRAAGDRVWETIAVAVNREYAGRRTVLRDRDEVALLPPVSGGAR